MVAGRLEGGLKGDILGVPVGHLLLAQPPPDGILVQLLMGRYLMLLCTSSTFVLGRGREGRGGGRLFRREGEGEACN